MAKKDFNFAPLPKIADKEKDKKVDFKLPTEKIKSETDYVLPNVEDITKVTFFIKERLKEKTNDYAYEEGLTQQDVIIKALELLLADKNPKPRPLSVKNRKVGRKKKGL